MAINVYPNPASDAINIETGNANIKTIEIRDILGNVVYSKTSHLSDERISVHSLSNGLYLIVVKDFNNNVLATEKLIIQK